MEKSLFKQFKEVIIEAGENDVVWSAGFLWLELTKRQIDQIYKILLEKPFLEESSFSDDKIGICLPSGLFIIKD